MATTPAWTGRKFVTELEAVRRDVKATPSASQPSSSGSARRGQRRRSRCQQLRYIIAVLDTDRLDGTRLIIYSRCGTVSLLIFCLLAGAAGLAVGDQHSGLRKK